MSTCLFVGADVADAMACISLPTHPSASMMKYIRKCLNGEFRIYHPGHRDRSSKQQYTDDVVDYSRYDPRGIRTVVYDKYVNSSAFWLFHTEDKRIVNNLLLYRWQRGGPTVYLKQACCRRTIPCDFRSKEFPNQPLGLNIPLALLWPFVFLDLKHAERRISNMDVSNFQQECLTSFVLNMQLLLEDHNAKITIPLTTKFKNTVQAWVDIWSTFSDENVTYVILLHTFQIHTNNIIDTYMEGLEFCYTHNLCPFSIGTALLQVLLLRTRNDNTTISLLDHWVYRLTEVDKSFSGASNTFYDYKRRGRSCPQELSHMHWKTIFDLSNGTKSLATMLLNC